MDLNQTINNFTGATSIVSNVQAHAASLQSLTGTMGGLAASLPALSSAGSAVTGMAGAAQDAMAGLIAKLPIALPAMKAVHLLEKKVEMAGGGIAGSSASATFSSYFGSFAAIESKMADLATSAAASLNGISATAASIPGVTGATPQAIFSSLAAAVPPAQIPDPNNAGAMMTNPAYTDFRAAHGAALTSMESASSALSGSAADGQSYITGQAAAADGLLKSGVGKLKALSFAQFCATPQPAAVTGVITQLVVPANIPKATDLDVVTRSSAKWTSSQTRAPDRPVFDVGNDKIPTGSPMAIADGYTPGAADIPKINALSAQIDQVRADGAAAAKAADALYATEKDWLAQVNFNALKNNRDRSPEDKAAYEAVKAQALARPTFVEMMRQYGIYNDKQRELTRLREIRIHMTTVGPWPGNPDGPW